MKILKISLALCLFAGFLYSQNTTSDKPYSLVGVVRDSITGDVIPYATVEVTSKDTSCHTIGYTDNQGQFSLTLPECDSLVLKVDFTDYLPATRQITYGRPVGDTLTFLLTPGGKELGEVAVYGYRQLVKLMPSGFSYDIGKDLRSKSEDLLSAMRRVPMVVVDGEGKITVKGTTNFSVYLNGKPLNMANTNPTQVLQSIPAANIAKIEMITNPDASYDTGAGTTIINIITAKGGIKGYNVSLTVGANTQPRANGDIIYNLVTDRLRLSATYDYFFDKHIKQPVSVKREIYLPGEATNTLTSTANNDGSNQYHTGRLMMEYDIDSVNMLYADGHILYERGDLQTDWYHTLVVGAGGTKSTHFTSTSYSNAATFETNILYRKLHRMNKSEIFSLGYRFSYNPDNRYHESVSQAEALPPLYAKSISDGGLYQHTVRLDGLLYNKNNIVVKGGISDVYRYSTAIPVYFTKNNSAADWAQISGDKRIIQRYNNIGAYLTSSYRRGIFDFRLGARLEHVDDCVWQTSADNTTVHYTYIVPRASIVSSPSDNTQLSLSYRYAIRRPSIQSINPYETRNSEYDISAGNPSLVPQKSHNMGLEGMIFGNNYFVNLSMDYENVRNPIYLRTEILPSSPEILYSKYDNFGIYQNAAASLFVIYRLTSFMRLNSFLNGGFCFFGDKDRVVTQQNFIYNITANVDFVIESLSAGASYGYTQTLPDWGQYNSHTYYYSFYVKKTFLKEKLEATLQINNPFNKYSRLTTYQWGDYYRQTRTNDVTSRSIGLWLSYKFGSGKKSDVERNRDLKPDDLDMGTGVD